MRRPSAASRAASHGMLFLAARPHPHTPCICLPTGCYYKKSTNQFDTSCSTQPDVCGAIQDQTEVVACCNWKEQVRSRWTGG